MTLYVHLLSQMSAKDAEILQLVFNATVQGSSGDFTVAISGDKRVNLSEVVKSGSVSIDNLERLNLIRPIPSYDSRSLVFDITSLGMSFVMACQFN